MTATSRPRPARARDAEATRADLLLAARRRFTALGYERTTSRDIASDAGANVSLIYRYFGSKEQLFELVLEETADMFGRLQGKTLEELVDGFLDGFRAPGIPQYGHKHPLLVFLRVADDDSRTALLRHQTLGASISYFAEQLARSHSEAPTEQDVARARVRAGLMFSTFAGVVALREAVPDDPFSRMDVEDLRAELIRIVTVIGGGQD